MIHLGIDANEANVKNRVGSNVYAFAVIKHLAKITENDDHYRFTLFLAQPPVADLPPARHNWSYKVLKPGFLFTQWALPLYLYQHQNKYDAFFTPGHYAPRFCPIPHVCSVMDLAYLHFPTQFKKTDLLQLKNWTKYSVNQANKIVTISQFSKSELVKNYQQQPADIVVAYPNVNLPHKPPLRSRERAFVRKHQIKSPYFLYLGTLQPRKNLLRVIKAFESFHRSLAAGKVKKRGRQYRQHQPQLVIAGKSGWLNQQLMTRIKKSPISQQLILTGYVDQSLKPWLYQHALANLNLGLYEGFGIPALEALHYKTLVIAANNTSLPEVVGKAGILVDPYDIKEISQAMAKVWTMTAKQKAKFRKKAREQVKKFSWRKTSKKILKVLTKLAQTKS
ncbi:MAG: glycosyltransferase [Candidatus Pacebacteria bacterium]|nr:glycosyltransferase [Candidatus Paceibacterota bacterium]